MGRMAARGFAFRVADLLFVAGLLLAGSVALPGCEPPGPRPGAPPKVGQGTPADNSHCLVCHLDFKAESLSASHEKAAVGCTSCHGASLAHGDDEFNIITPDVLYGRGEIDAFCKGCHETHRKGKAYQAFLKDWEDKRRPNGRIISDESVCTDCHGNHVILTPDKQIHSPVSAPPEPSPAAARRAASHRPVQPASGRCPSS